MLGDGREPRGYPGLGSRSSTGLSDYALVESDPAAADEQSDPLLEGEGGAIEPEPRVRSHLAWHAVWVAVWVAGLLCGFVGSVLITRLNAFDAGSIRALHDNDNSGTTLSLSLQCNI